MSACETSRQTLSGMPNFCNCGVNFRGELGEIVRSKVFSGMADMGPNELHRIEFRRTDWKRVNMQTRLRLNEVLNQASLMNRMVVPDQNHRTCQALQDLLKEQDHVLTTQIHSKGSGRQFHFSSAWTDQNRTEQIQALMVFQTGIRVRGLATRCPTAAQWRNQ